MSAPLLFNLTDRCGGRLFGICSLDRQEQCAEVAIGFDLISFTALSVIIALGITGTLPMATGLVYGLEALAGAILLLYIAALSKQVCIA